MADIRKWKATGSRLWNEEDDEDLECALETDWYVRFDADEALKAALRMREAIRNGMNVMPSLKRVVMTGAVDNERNIEEQYVAKGMGDVLLSLPSVGYYCQSSALGPLSMSNTISQPLHPPRIAIFHLSRSSKIWKSSLYPPIVVGAINRYIFSGGLRLESPRPLIPSDITAELADAMFAIVNMLCMRNWVEKQTAPGGFVLLVEDSSTRNRIPFSSAFLNDTKIEIYNWIVNVIGADPNVIESLEKKPERIHPLSRDVCETIERLLDDRIGPWRGKVILRNADDVPACPACAYDGPIPTNETVEYKDGGLLGENLF